MMNLLDADDCFAFVPLRNGKPLVRFDDDDNNNDTRRFVIAIHSNKMQSIGRLDILRSVWNACLHNNSVSTSSSTTTLPQQEQQRRCECPVCKRLGDFLKGFSRKDSIQIRSNQPKNEGSDVSVFQIKIRKMDWLPPECIEILTVVGTDDERSTLLPRCSAYCKNDNNNEWMGPWRIQCGDIIRFRNPWVTSEIFFEMQLCQFLIQSNSNSNQLVPCRKRIPSQPPLPFPDDNRLGIAPVLYLVPLGLDMEKAVLEFLRPHVERRGAIVLGTFDKNRPPWPTHFVVSDRIQPQQIATELGFQDEYELGEFLQKHDIVCAKKIWAEKGSKYQVIPFTEPDRLEEQYHRIPTKKKKLRNQATNDDETTIELEQYKQQHPMQSTCPRKPRNQNLSNLFREISKLYQQCPLEEQDDWRAYTYNLLAGRLCLLDFDVTNDSNNVLSKLKAIQGFGNSTVKDVQEFLETGVCSRLEMLKNDKDRQAMKAMMNIWGVGPKEAHRLIQQGYRNIGTVRKAMNDGILKLERNQWIGVQFYEDFLDEMSREEVGAIADRVFQAVRQRYPSAEMTIMGSYRRGKPRCGDVDILITHPNFPQSVPPKALGSIVDDLRQSGDIVHHLTFISGMKHELFETLSASDLGQLKYGESHVRTQDKKDKFSSSSWMGVFASPSVQEMRRRVDIKFYPYSERIYASLYFTGNGHFNRSMRLWATRKFDYRLSDHGLEHKDTQTSVLENPSTEKEVFDFLNLKWKEPCERDGFDAVEGKDTGELSCQLEEMTKGDLLRDKADNHWIQ
jgi:DNA polymerase/3'-5' exonuclease PolX